MLACRQRLSERFIACKVLQPLLGALAYLHEQGIVHRYAFALLDKGRKQNSSALVVATKSTRQFDISRVQQTGLEHCLTVDSQQHHPWDHVDCTHKQHLHVLSEHGGNTPGTCRPVQ